MKTRVLLLLCAILSLAACNDDNVVPLTPTEPEPTQPITFNLTATRPGDAAATRSGESGGWQWQSWDDDEPDGEALPAMTRAMKTDWEAGDAIFVFFTSDDYYSRVTVPIHLKMTYDGTTWTSVEYDGPTPSPGVLSSELSRFPTGTMTAVHLPYGNDATVSVGGEPDQYGKYHTFAFSETPRAYYMTATLPYEVIDNTVSGAFDMRIADGFVQIFLPDDEADQYAECQLVLDAINPVRVASISDDGTITEIETTEIKRLEANDFTLPRYVYNDSNVKGYLFYGKVSDSYRDPGNYCFAMTKTSYNHGGNNNSGDEYEHPSGSGPTVIRERYDYLVVGKTLASRAAIRLPAVDNINTYKDDGKFPTGKWQKMGEHETVKLRNFADDGITIKDDVGTWYTCDFGTSVPEWYNIHTSRYTYEEAKGKTSELGVLPSLEQFKALSWKSKKWSYACVNGYGRAIAQFDTGFMWIEGYYWTNEDLGDQVKMYIISPFEITPATDPNAHTWEYRGRDEKWFVRLMAR